MFHAHDQVAVQVYSYRTQDKIESKSFARDHLVTVNPVSSPVTSDGNLSSEIENCQGISLLQKRWCHTYGQLSSDLITYINIQIIWKK